MKRYFKLLTIIVVAFVMMIGINVNAEDDYYIYPNGAQIRIAIPIHKTDTNKKALEGAIFTLKDFNNTISYSSSNEGDGDYLIEVNKQSMQEAYGKREAVDQEYRIIDETNEDKLLTDILDIIPAKYSDVFRKAQNQDDLMNMLDLPLLELNSNEYSYFVGFYVPLKVEETVVPTGYKAKNIVVPAFVFISFNDGAVGAYLSYSPGYSYSPFGLESIPAYFEYNAGTNYEELFDNINKKLARTDSSCSRWINNYISFFIN